MLHMASNSKGFDNEKVKGTDNYDPYLQEAGFAITDNEGRFEFITIMPGSIDNQALLSISYRYSKSVI